MSTVQVQMIMVGKKNRGLELSPFIIIFVWEIFVYCTSSTSGTM
jgi:hypothetical protein